MGRLKELRKYIDNELNMMEDADKHTVDSPMDELLKDADVIRHTLNDSFKAVKGEGVPVALLFEPTGAKRRQGAGQV